MHCAFAAIVWKAHYNYQFQFNSKAMVGLERKVLLEILSESWEICQVQMKDDQKNCFKCLFGIFARSLNPRYTWILFCIV